MKQNFSVFDYSVVVVRKNRYLVLSCPELGIQISSDPLDRLRAENLGNAMIQLFGKISERLHNHSPTSQFAGRTVPAPYLRSVLRSPPNQDRLSTKKAAQLLGTTVRELRARVARGEIQVSRTPGGHLRFSLSALAELQTRLHPAIHATAPKAKAS